jgi:transglutaminase-like putative cysteine protease
MIHFDTLPTSTDGFTGATDFLDFDSPEVGRFVDEAIVGATHQRERAVRLFYAVRDKIRYDPYRISADSNDYRASQVINAGHGWCIPKAGLLAACARRVGIPSAVGLADVVNHLTSEKLRKQMGGLNVFYDHGYTALYIDGQWLKAVPAFNIELCTRFEVMPTEFDGTADALYQPYDAKQRLHMEYLADHGTFSDLPLQRVLDDLDRHYPSIVKRGDPVDASERFEDDATR